jgi:hypothetical protein
MRSRTSARLGVIGSIVLCVVAACTGDDEIYAVPKDAGSAAIDGPGTPSSGGPSSSSSGGTGTEDGSTTNDAGADGGDDGSATDAGDGGTGDGGSDSGADSGPVVCAVVPCADNVTCTAVGCGSCNMGLGFCKP